MGTKSTSQNRPQNSSPYQRSCLDNWCLKSNIGYHRHKWYLCWRHHRITPESWLRILSAANTYFVTQARPRRQTSTAKAQMKNLHISTIHTLISIHHRPARDHPPLMILWTNFSRATLLPLKYPMNIYIRSWISIHLHDGAIIWLSL